MRIVKPSKTRRRNVAAVHDTNSPLAATYQYDKDSRRKKLGGRMAKTVIVTKFHSSAFKHASESALRRESLSGRLYLTPASRRVRTNTSPHRRHTLKKKKLRRVQLKHLQ